MITKTIKYIDYNGKEQTETLYFNLTQTEILEMAMELPESVSNKFTGSTTLADTEKAAAGMLETLGRKGIVDFIKKLLLKSYGIKAEDGKHFKKNDTITEDFQYSPAFDTVFMELMTNDKAAADFINGVIPAKAIENMAAMKQGTPAIPMK